MPKISRTLTFPLLMAIGLTILVSFQNCGENNPDNTPPAYKPATNLSLSGSEVTIVQDLSGYESTTTGGCIDIEIVIRGTPRSYQWLHNGTTVDNQRNESSRPTELRVCNVTAADAGEYRLRMTLSDDEIDSGVVQIVVDGAVPTPTPGPGATPTPTPGPTATPTPAPGVTAPVITQQPVDVTISEGATSSISVVASGTGLTYQWYWANPERILSGHIYPTLPLGTNYQWPSVNYAFARVTNSAGMAQTRVAIVRVVNRSCPGKTVPGSSDDPARVPNGQDSRRHDSCGVGFYGNVSYHCNNGVWTEVRHCISNGD